MTVPDAAVGANPPFSRGGKREASKLGATGSVSARAQRSALANKPTVVRNFHRGKEEEEPSPVPCGFGVHPSLEADDKTETVARHLVAVARRRAAQPRAG